MGCVCACVCVRGACVWGGSQRTAGGGARQLAPHLVAPPTPPSHYTYTDTHTSSTLPSGLGWHGAGVEFGDGGQNQGFNQYTSLVKDRPTAAVANSPPTAYGAVLISGLTGLAP